MKSIKFILLALLSTSFISSYASASSSCVDSGIGGSQKMTLIYAPGVPAVATCNIGYDKSNSSTILVKRIDKFGTTVPMKKGTHVLLSCNYNRHVSGSSTRFTIKPQFISGWVLPQGESGSISQGHSMVAHIKRTSNTPANSLVMTVGPSLSLSSFNATCHASISDD